MASKLRIGLVGAGKFGGYHANKLAAHRSVDFIGVFDVSKPAATALGDYHNVEVFEHFEHLLGAVDHLIIAAPASYHGDYAIEALSQGKNLLIEKPMATSSKQAAEIVRLADLNSLILQVGHQERYVGRAIGLHKIPEKPVLIRAQRLNPYSSRGTDTTVTMDLMIHDIDLVLWLMGEKPQSVAGQGRRVKSVSSDHTTAELTFKNGTAFLESSRIAETGHRSLELCYPSGTITIDLNAKTLTHNTPFKLNSKFGKSSAAKDSLAAGLNEFVSAIRENRAPFISAMDGYNAVNIAAKIDGK